MANNTHSVVFNGSDQFSSRTDTASLSIQTDFTIEAWIKLASLPSTSNSFIIASKYNTTDTKRSYLFRIDSSDDKMEVFFSDDGSSSSNLVADTAFTSSDVDVWRHVAVTVDISTPSATFYKDTSADSTTNVSTTDTTIQDNDSEFMVGAQNKSISPINESDGKINNLRVWGDIRTAQEISDNWKKVLDNTGSDNLIDSWYYNNNHRSASGNNDLTGANSPTFSADIPFGLNPANPIFFSNPGLALG